MKRVRLAVVAACLMATAACSPNGPEVPLEQSGAVLEGTIYLGEKKVPDALVIVVRVGTGGGSAQAFADEAGNYRVENAPVGPVQIGVNSEAATGARVARQMAGVDMTNAKSKKGAAVPALDAPKKYADPLKSGIKTTVEGKGVTKFDIKLAP